MEENIFTNPDYSQFVKSIGDISNETFTLKSNFFKNNIIGNTINPDIISNFKMKLNDFLKYWDDIFRNNVDASKTVNIDNCCMDNIDVLDHSFIQNYVYSKYDYASIIQFIDGIVKGINSGRITKPSEIEDFKDHTLNLAFNNQDVNIGGLVDSVSDDYLSPFTKKCTPFDIKIFGNIRNYNNLYNHRDRIELYKSLVETISNFNMINNTIMDKNLNLDTDAKILFINALNSIGEYINYTLTIYATKCYILSKYLSSFKNTNCDDTTITEQVSITDILELPYTDKSSILRNTDELIIKDPDRFYELVQRMISFLNALKVDIEYSDLSKNYPTIVKPSKLYNKLKDTVFYNFFVDDHSYINSFCANRSSYNYMNTLLNEIVSNINSDTKYEFINIIKNIEYGKTVKDYTTLAKDTVIVCFDLMNRLLSVIQIVNNMMDDYHNDMSYLKMEQKLYLGESKKILINLYKEIIFVFVQKLYYIEQKINNISFLNSKKSFKQLELDIFNAQNIDLNHTMALSTYVDNFDKSIIDKLYESSTFDLYEMYDAYLRTLPEFENELYLKEALDTNNTNNDGNNNNDNTNNAPKNKLINKAGNAVSTIINKIKSILIGLWKKIISFWNNKSFERAKKWVLDNENSIRNLTFAEDATLEVLPYKDDITLPKGFDNLQKNLMNFNESYVKDNDSIQKYLKTLYPSDQVAKWFAEDSTGKVAAQRYMNLILFDDGSQEPVKPIEVKGKDINKYINMWVDTIKESDDIQNSFKKINDSIVAGINSVNAKIVNISNSYKNSNNSSSSSSSTDASKAGNMDNVSNNIDTPDNKIALLSKLTERISVTVTRIWSPVAPIIIQAILNQYNYIKNSYNIAESIESNNTNQTNTEQNEL